MPRGRPNQKDGDGAPFIPTEEQIAEVAKEIRERGFRDKSGKWHGPWIEGNDSREVESKKA